jgi:peptide/nickel transport system substrate-binding protein
LSRRAALLGLSCALVARGARARSRDAPGGRISFRMPWPLAALDPHRIDDIGCAVLGDAVFDTLYAPSNAGADAFAPVLAEAEPEVVDGAVRVAIRAGLHTARGRAFAAKDAAFSIARARASGATAWLTEIAAPHVDGNALVFPHARDANKIARALSSPLVAMVPTAFRPDAPDGTGAFRADRTAEGFSLVRNARAATGPSFLESATVRRAADLAASLRAFESGEDDLGWLGAGLHEPRPGSLRFDAGAVAFAVLRTGREGGTWDAPGVAQSLADGIAPSRLGHLGLGAPWTSDGSAKWGGGATAIVVRDDSPWLVELARAVASALTSTASDVGVRPVPLAEVEQRRASRAFALMVDAVRPFGRGYVAETSALAAADEPQRGADIVRRPPRGELPARVMARTLRLGVLGEIRVSGGRVPDVDLLVSTRAPGVDWGAAHRGRGKSA